MIAPTITKLTDFYPELSGELGATAHRVGTRCRCDLVYTAVLLLLALAPALIDSTPHLTLCLAR